jgi:hypothetical protein
VALRKTSGPVTISVGRPSAAIGIQFERLKISWSPVPARGVGFRGITTSKGPVAPRDRMWVTLAGPIATVLLLPVYVALAILTAGDPGWIPATFGLGALACFVGLLFNLDPRPADAAERAGTKPMGRDGPQAMAAYREMRRSGQDAEGALRGGQEIR